MSSQTSRAPPFVHATGWGLCAYLVGYAVTYLWSGGYARDVASAVVVGFQGGAASDTRLTFLLVDEAVADTTWAGWLFANAHLVPLTTGNFPFSAGTLVPNILLAAPASRYLLLFAVPPITLCLAGALVSRHTTRGLTTISPSLDLRLPNSAVRGTGITMGYLPCVVVGAVLFSATTVDARVEMLAPDLFLSLLVAGLLYPMVFGGLGGWLATKWTVLVSPYSVSS
jgi:hypothetical protein